VCSDLWLEEHRNIPNQTTSRALHDELRLLRRRALLTRAFSSFTTVALGAASFEVGWKIGTGIRNMFMKDTMPAKAANAPANNGSDPRLTPVDRGAVILIAEPGFTDVTAPSDGYLLQFWGGPSNSLVDVRGMDPACNSVAGAWRGNVPAGMVEYTRTRSPNTAGNNCLVWDPVNQVNNTVGNANKRTVLFLPAGKLDSKGGVTEDYVAQTPVTGGNNSGALANPGNAAVKAKAQTELATGDYPTLNKVYTHKFDPTTPDPLVDVAVMPSCVGLTYTACVVALQAAGFGVYHRVSRSFANATPIPQAQAAQVFGTTPAAGASTAVSTDVAVDANPDYADMPIAIPAPGARQTYAAYQTQLEGLGLTMGAPHVLSEELGDPQRGPNEVTTTSPAPGGRAHPGDAVTPSVNPPDWPVPAAGGGAGCDTSIRGFNLNPLNVGLGNVFPFGVFGWLAAAMGGWGGTSSAPNWTFKLGTHIDWHVDLAVIEPAMQIVRPCILIVSMLGIVWMLSASAMGISRGSEE
jgi:hypothetical protein